jgi:hypothetical protein
MVDVDDNNLVWTLEVHAAFSLWFVLSGRCCNLQGPIEQNKVWKT